MKATVANMLHDSFADRRSTAAAARSALIATFKPKPAQPASEPIDRAGERAARLKQVRDERALARTTRKAAALANQEAATQAVTDPETAVSNARRGERKMRTTLSAADAKAKRDARYAARQREGRRLNNLAAELPARTQPVQSGQALRLPLNGRSQETQMLEQVDLAVSSPLSLVPEAEYETGPSQLSQGAYHAPRQLERRLRTGALDAVNIRGAQELVLQGLAHHARGGWRPTRDGLNYLSQHQDHSGGDVA